MEASGSTVRREIAGGLTTFATMSYIVFVQPAVLSAAGMDLWVGDAGDVSFGGAGLFSDGVSCPVSLRVGAGHGGQFSLCVYRVPGDGLLLSGGAHDCVDRRDTFFVAECGAFSREGD